METLNPAIARLHSRYIDLTGRRIPLDAGRESDWFLWAKKFDESDLVTVVNHLQRRIKEGVRRPECLKFSNLIIMTDYFEEDLAEAKAQARKPVVNQAKASVLKATGRPSGPPQVQAVSAGVALERTKIAAMLSKWRMENA